jgi:hypothetical protein
VRQGGLEGGAPRGVQVGAAEEAAGKGGVGVSGCFVVTINHIASVDLRVSVFCN